MGFEAGVRKEGYEQEMAKFGMEEFVVARIFIGCEEGKGEQETTNFGEGGWKIARKVVIV